MTPCRESHSWEAGVDECFQKELNPVCCHLNWKTCLEFGYPVEEILILGPP